MRIVHKKQRIQKFKEEGDSRYIYKNESDKSCFQHDMAYGDFKYLAKRTALDNVLKIKHLILLKIKNIIDKFFDKKSNISGASNEIKWK